MKNVNFTCRNTHNLKNKAPESLVGRDCDSKKLVKSRPNRLQHMVKTSCTSVNFKLASNRIVGRRCNIFESLNGSAN